MIDFVSVVSFGICIEIGIKQNKLFDIHDTDLTNHNMNQYHYVININ